jgi:hypothetical protein
MSVLTNTINTSTNNDTSIPIFVNDSYDNNVDAPIIDNNSIHVSVSDRNDEERVDLSTIKVPVFRFKLATTVFDNIREFARIHQYEDRLTFKDSWKTWGDNNKTLIDDETKRLSDIGFDNNINDKLFRTAKYYFIKKKFNNHTVDINTSAPPLPEQNHPPPNTLTTSADNIPQPINEHPIGVIYTPSTRNRRPVTHQDTTGDANNQDKKKYITISRTFLNTISNQIEKNIGNDSFTPSKGFKHFTENFNDNITNEITLIKEKLPGISDDDCNIKIKKTYKNKYFQYTNKYGTKQNK